MRATMPRLTASSAISRPVHWLIGRADSAGASQANAMSRQVCSLLIRQGPPGRGASSSRSATLNAVNGSVPKSSQRVRHSRAVSTFTARWRAICALFSPAAAARMMRARSTVCCAAPRRRRSASNACRSSAVNVTVGGFGPRINPPSQRSAIPLTASVPD